MASQGLETEADVTQAAAYLLHRGDAREAYEGWPTPVTIISDGAYGVRGFHGDTVGTAKIAEWYRPHIAAWSRPAGAARTARPGWARGQCRHP